MNGNFSSQALFLRDWVMDQLWLFWGAPINRAIVASLLYKYLSPENSNKKAYNIVRLLIF